MGITRDIQDNIHDDLYNDLLFSVEIALENHRQNFLRRNMIYSEDLAHTIVADWLNGAHGYTPIEKLAEMIMDADAD